MIPNEPLFSINISDSTVGLEGFLCIHSMGRFGAAGGIRCVADVTAREVQLLAKAMCFKYSFFSIEQGGAKAGLKIDYADPPERRRTLLRAAAKHLEPLIRKNMWSPWTDMNFYATDLSEFYSGIGIQHEFGGKGGSSFRTAVSAAACLNAVADHLKLKAGARVAIEGFGSVARFLVPFMKERGFRLVATTNHREGVHRRDGLDLTALLHRSNGRTSPLSAGGGDRIEPEEIFDFEVDVFIPCARVHSINEDRASRLKTVAVVPISNVPCTEPALAKLAQRRILYLPDYVVNGGGVCGHLIEDRAVDDRGALEGFMVPFGNMVKRMLELSEADSKTPQELADQIAHHNYAGIAKKAYDSPSMSARIVQRAENAGLLPRIMTKRALRRRIETTVAGLNSMFR